MIWKCLSNSFELLSEKAIYWSDQKKLILADLHIGKSSTFQNAGLWLPHQAEVEDIQRLISLLKRFEVHEILILGDLIHSEQGPSELLSKHIKELKHLLNYRKIIVTLILGNHENSFSDEHQDLMSFINIQESLSHGPFKFTHDVFEKLQSESDYFLFGGHLHPAMNLKHGADKLFLPVFWTTGKFMILPAFSSLAGHCTLKYKRDEKFYLVADQKVVEFG